MIRGDEDGRETALEVEEAVGLASAVVTLLRRQTKGPQDAVLVLGIAVSIIEYMRGLGEGVTDFEMHLPEPKLRAFGERIFAIVREKAN